MKMLRKILAEEGLTARTKLKTLKTKTLQPGTRLYHGTSAMAEFTQLNKESWFGFDPHTAKKWATWGGDKGRTRVLVFTVWTPVNLIDTIALEDWEALSDFLQVEDTTYEMRKGVLKKRLPGWYGETEVLISDPERFLTYDGEV